MSSKKKNDGLITIPWRRKITHKSKQQYNKNQKIIPTYHLNSLRLDSDPINSVNALVDFNLEQNHGKKQAYNFKFRSYDYDLYEIDNNRLVDKPLSGWLIFKGTNHVFKDEQKDGDRPPIIQKYECNTTCFMDLKYIDGNELYQEKYKINSVAMYTYTQISGKYYIGLVHEKYGVWNSTGGRADDVTGNENMTLKKLCIKEFREEAACWYRCDVIIQYSFIYQNTFIMICYMDPYNFEKLYPINRDRNYTHAQIKKSGGEITKSRGVELNDVKNYPPKDIFKEVYDNLIKLMIENNKFGLNKRYTIEIEP
jgi:hypothetical protein